MEDALALRVPGEQRWPVVTHVIGPELVRVRHRLRLQIDDAQAETRIARIAREKRGLRSVGRDLHHDADLVAAVLDLLGLLPVPRPQRVTLLLRAEIGRVEEDELLARPSESRAPVEVTLDLHGLSVRPDHRDPDRVPRLPDPSVVLRRRDGDLRAVRRNGPGHVVHQHVVPVDRRLEELLRILPLAVGGHVDERLAVLLHEDDPLAVRRDGRGQPLRGVESLVPRDLDLILEAEGHREKGDHRFLPVRLTS